MSMVLILGAGASHPYGFPLGNQLKAEVLNQTQNLVVTNPLKSVQKYSEDLIKRFQYALRFSRAQTIDELLGKKIEFRDIGAHLIAAAIAAREHGEKILPARDWYAELYDQLSFECDNSDICNFAIVTLNYDRSLEFFLHEAINLDCHHAHVARAHKKRESIRIVHAHGSLGKFPDVPYRVDLGDANAMQRAAMSIKIVSDRLEDSLEYQEAQHLIATARRIVFLGVGYHESILRGLFATTNPKEKEVWGSAINVDDSTMEFVKTFFGNDCKLIHRGAGAREFLVTTKIVQNSL